MRTPQGRGEGYLPGVQLALFALTPAPAAAARSGKAETRLKILAGVVALGVVRKEAAAARAFLQAVEASTLNERDRGVVRRFVGRIDLHAQSRTGASFPRRETP